MPFLMLCYVAAFLDRVNVGFAKLTMLHDLGIGEAAYGFGAGLFFVGYFLFETPSNVLMHRIGARATLSRIMILWAFISGAFAFVQAEWQFYTLRFLLGAAEAGFYPGVILYLTYWFPSARRARVIALFICAIPLSGLLGGPLSGWILSSLHGSLSLHGWQWLFLVEALPSLALGLLVLAYLDDTPNKSSWLSVEEKAAIQRDLDEDQSLTPRRAGWAGVLSGIVVLLSIVVFCQAMGQYGLSFWLPTLIAQAGAKDPLTVGLLSAVPFSVAIVCMLLSAWNSDRTNERRWHLAIAFLVGGVGLSASTFLTGNVPASMVALCIAAAGCYTVSALVWSLPPLFLTGVGAAAGIAVINSFGSLAGFLSPFAIGWIRETTQSTNIGMLAISVFMMVGAVLMFIVPKPTTGGTARTPNMSR
ncbi:MFS transporter [Methylobacterium nodulans]|uniref:MFS transporter n=1 Tax=Methylobacterium nodulans TaxID=114616 RepID=UPI001FCB6E0F|nr:MFS transporter [Methylobacterium nodulans]